MNGTPMTHFLANVIAVFHACIVLFVIVVPFLNYQHFLILHIVFCLSLLVHWYGNSNVCSLSMLESKFRGMPYTDSFTHRFVAPMYDVSKTSWSKICYTVTILLLAVSCYKVYHSEKWRVVCTCLNDTRGKLKDEPLKDKVVLYLQCFQEFFSP